ncbi:hypothetical protein [Pseudonocardia sp. NPDC049154]|uniref:hypothetical protein n=1 Tax=Pseudonocardia sp. NPDC049154 TaxID=3155501 RepID=UPI0033C1823A
MAERLATIRRRLSETVLPALPADADFAREQGEFVLQALDLLEAVAHLEYRYDLVEAHDYRRALTELAAILPTDHELVDPLAGATAVPLPTPDPRPSPAALADHVRMCKELVGRVFTVLARGDDRARALEVLRELADRQVERERALFAPTGATTSSATLAHVLTAVHVDDS